MALEEEEFIDKVGTEYVAPEPVVLVIYKHRNPYTDNGFSILNKKDLPKDSVYIGQNSSVPKYEEWWSWEKWATWVREG